MQPAAIFDDNFKVLSALSDPNDYRGPGTGYRVDGQRWSVLQNLTQAREPRALLEKLTADQESDWFTETKAASPGEQPEVVIAVSPAFGVQIKQSISGLDLRNILAALLKGVSEEGIACRVVRVYHTADVAFIGHAGAKLSGSGVAVGIQSKGTVVVHQRDLDPLENLELLSQAPNLELENYTQIGRNAARYALGKPTTPVAANIDNTARLRLIVQTTLLQHFETQQIKPDQPPMELNFTEWR